jgi:pimeloyl-ACP methyl ester carboxylesterase
MDTAAADLAALVETLCLANAIHVGHSTGDGEVACYIGRRGTKRLAKAVLIGAVQPLMLRRLPSRRPAHGGVRPDPRRRPRRPLEVLQGSERALLRCQSVAKVSQGPSDERPRATGHGPALPVPEPACAGNRLWCQASRWCAGRWSPSSPDIQREVSGEENPACPLTLTHSGAPQLVSSCGAPFFFRWKPGKRRGQTRRILRARRTSCLLVSRVRRPCFQPLTRHNVGMRADSSFTDGQHPHLTVVFVTIMSSS